MESSANEHSLPPVYPSPSTTTRSDDGIEGEQKPDINPVVKLIDDKLKLKLKLKESTDDKLKESTSATGRNEAPMFFIPKIPEILQRDKNGTGPKIISIGPNHRENPWLQSMEDEKFRRLNEMLKETGLSLKQFVEVLAPLENQVRGCYSDTRGIESKDFVEMMLLDSCFIIHLLSLVRTDATKLDGMSWISPLLFNDLLLLENQLPFSLIQRVFEIKYTNKCGKSSPSLVQIALDFYHVVSKTEKHPNEKLFTPPAGKVHHLLQLYHWLQMLPLIGDSTQKPPKSKWINFCPIFHDHAEKYKSKWINFCPLFHDHAEKYKSKWINFYPTVHDHAEKYLEGQNYDEESGITIPSATALHEAGIKFKKKKGNSILDVNFSDGVLEIPHLLIQHGAVSVFQSLIALEQCLGFYNNNLPQFTVYFYFMDHIINTDSDVKLLQKSGIIEYAHGSEEEVADLFNQLTRGATINPNNYLSGSYKGVNSYCKKKRHIWGAIFRRRHCSNPWTILSLIGALILLVLTFIQSYFSVYAYFRPS